MYLGYLTGSAKVPDFRCWQRLRTGKSKYCFYVREYEMEVVRKMIKNGWNLEVRKLENNQYKIIPPNHNTAYRYAVSIILRESSKYLNGGLKGVISSLFGRWTWKTDLPEEDVIAVLNVVPEKLKVFSYIKNRENEYLEDARKTSTDVVASS